MAKILTSDIGTYIVSKGLATALATDVFIDTMPDKPDLCIAVHEYPGVPSQVASADDRSIQIEVRGATYEAARSKIWAIYKAFHDPESDVCEIWISTTRWGVFRPRQTPFKLMEDDEKRVYFVFNMGVVTHRDE